MLIIGLNVNDFATLRPFVQTRKMNGIPISAPDISFVILLLQTCIKAFLGYKFVISISKGNKQIVRILD